MRARAFTFDSGGLRLAGELVLPDDAPSWVVLLCHGIPSGRPPQPDDTGYAGLARALAQRGFAAAWFDFRGARESPGEFSIAGWHADLAAAIEAVRAHPDAPDAPLCVCGSSAGGAAAICVAAERPEVAAVATFAAPAEWEFEDASSETNGLLAYCRNIGIVRDPAFPPDPAAWLAEFDRFRPDEAVWRISPRPLLVVHGDSDDVVPYPHAERLFERAGSPKELVRIPGGGHQLRRDARAIEALCDWLGHTDAPRPRTSAG